MELAFAKAMQRQMLEIKETIKASIESYPAPKAQLEAQVNTQTKEKPEAGKSNNRLNSAQNFALCKWIEKAEQEFLDSATLQSLAGYAQAALGFYVTKANISGALDVTGRQRNTSGEGGDQELRKRIAVLEAKVATLEAAVDLRLPPVKF